VPPNFAKAKCNSTTFIMIQKFGQSTKTSSDLWLPTMSGQQVPSRLLCFIHITRTKNNTHATISNLFESKNQMGHKCWAIK
jgi:hypothetical protein